MSSSDTATELAEPQTSKAEPNTGRRLLIAAVVCLILAFVVLVAGVIWMQENDRSLKGTIAELKPIQDDVTGDDNKAQHGTIDNGRRVRLARAKRAVQCEPLRIRLCRDMPYNSVQFPNHLNHQTQDEAIVVANELAPLVKADCSSSMKPFLCSVLAPPCNGTQKPISPCKELCKRATKGCKKLLKKFQIMSHQAMRCKHLPKEGVSSCFNGSWPKTEMTPSPAPKTECRQVTHQCNRYSSPPYWSQFPNFFGHMNDKEAWASFQKFEVIFQIAPKECTSLLAKFLCRLHAPPCRNTQNPLPPCRELCLDVKSECRRAIRNVTKANGFQWPSELKCRSFLKKDEASCYSGPSEETLIPQKGKCQPIKIPLCHDVPYNMTVFPNFFHHKNQEEAALEVHQFSPLVKVKCSDDLAFFLCSLYAPLCSALDTPPPPCRALCLRAQRGCLPLMQRYGFDWPDSMKCDKFPIGGREAVCIDTPDPKTDIPVEVTTLPPFPTKAGTCEPLSVPTCRAMEYGMTWVPNYFQHQTQDQAARELKKYDPIIQTSCSPWLTYFLCSLYAPDCTPYTHNIPCKELCIRVKKSCIPRMRELGIKWPVSCSKFPRKAEQPHCIDVHPSRLVTKATPSKGGRCDTMVRNGCFFSHWLVENCAVIRMR